MGSSRGVTLEASSVEPGEYQLVTTGFDAKKTPFLLLQKDEVFSALHPLQKTLTLRFNKTERRCIGYSDITTGERFICDDQRIVDSKYDQCAVCQNKTGFNPAFYHAASVSPQQEARNAEPHILYLAHFAPGIIKVGISHAKRELSRLLEQGARTAIILDTFSSAHVARQYEAKIAQMPNIQETIQMRKKVALLTQDYDASAGIDELTKTKDTIEQLLRVSFASSQPLALDEYYFPAGKPTLSNTHDCTSEALLSGNTIGMLGAILCCIQQETLLYLPIKQYTGYVMHLSYNETTIDLPATQMSLF